MLEVLITDLSTDNLEKVGCTEVAHSFIWQQEN